MAQLRGTRPRWASPAPAAPCPSPPWGRAREHRDRGRDGTLRADRRLQLPAPPRRFRGRAARATRSRTPGRRPAGRRRAPRQPPAPAARAGVRLDAHREALGASRVEYLLAVLGTARLQDELDRGLAHVDLDPVAQMLDVDHVPAVIRDHAQQAGERAGPVRHHRGQHHPPPGRGLGQPDRLRGAATRARSPPDSTAHTEPSGGPSTRPCISAATATAPAPSTTSFERSSRSTIACATWSSDTVTTSCT